MISLESFFFSQENQPIAVNILDCNKRYRRSKTIFLMI